MARSGWQVSVAFFGLLIAAPAGAAVYTDAASFAGALSASNTANFNALGDGFYGGPGFGGAGTLASAGVAISTTTNYLFTQANNQYGTGTFVSVQQLAPAMLTLSFATSTALGFYYDSAAPLTVTFGGQAFTLEASPFPELRFFGVTSTTPFESVAVASTAFGLDIDNVTFGAAAVPEPGVWFMMVAGLGLIGARLRQKRATRFTAA